MRREAAVLTRRSLYQQKDPRLKDVSTHCGNSMIAHTRKSIIGPSVLQRCIITLTSLLILQTYAYVDTELRRSINPQS